MTVIIDSVGASIILRSIVSCTLDMDIEILPCDSSYFMPVCSTVKLVRLGAVNDQMHYCTRHLKTI